MSVDWLYIEIIRQWSIKRFPILFQMLMLCSLPDMWRLEYDTTETSLFEILQTILWLNAHA